MKKISVFVCLLLLLSVCILPVSAAGSGSMSGSASVTAGNTSDYTVNISGCPDATSVSVSVSLGNNLSLVSGSWLKSGSITNFEVAKSKGALGGLSSPNINGNLFKLTVKGNTPSATAQSVSIIVTAKNGGTEIFNRTFTKSVTVNCATHSFGSWSKLNDNQHTRTCSACGHVETVNHSWNGGTVTKNATCKETGTKEYTCTACGAKKTETIAKSTVHSWGAYKTTKEPTCTAAGTETATCSVCGTTTSRNIPATGHSFGAWQTSKAATCTAGGVETRTCSKCKVSETRNTSALGHSFSSPKVTKQPTCTEPGEQTGKCSRCGQTTSQSIKATGHKFGNWVEDTAATCTAGGVQKRVCSKCNAEEKRNTEPLGHDFENPTVVKDATIYSTGLMEGKCKRCGEATQEVIPCGYKDENTGVSIETSEGVFSEGTVINVELVDNKSEVYTSAKNILADISKDFTLYNVYATLNGEKVVPNGNVKITFNIPENYAKELSLYFVGEDGTSERLDTTVSEDGKTVTIETAKMGLFSICNPDDAESTETKAETKSENSSNLWIYIVIVVAVLLVVGGIVIALVIKKRKG